MWRIKLAVVFLCLALASPSWAARESVATDDFNRSTLGANWAQVNAGWGSLVTCADTVLCVGSTGGGQSNRPAARWVGAGTFTDNQYAKITIDALAWISNVLAIGPICRASGDTDGARDYYFFEIEYNAAGPTYPTRLGKVVNGSVTVLNSASQTWANGDSIEIECEDDQIRGVRNGVALGGGWTRTDPDLTTGQPGVTLAGEVSPLRPSGDNFEAGNLTAGSPAVFFRRRAQ